MKKLIVIIAGLLVLGGGGYFAYDMLTDENANQTPSATDTEEQMASESDETAPAEQKPADNFMFGQPTKAAHYVSNTPEHGAVLDAAPEQVSINFNFDLAPPSAISIAKDGQEVGSGQTVIGGDKLLLSRAIAAGAGPGLYTVTYTACWPDGSCHDGQFQFGVKE